MTHAFRATKLKVFLLAFALGITGAVAIQAHPAKAGGDYVVGVSNTLVGNGWREKMICSIKAQAQASGNVSKVIVDNRNMNAQQQAAGLRKLISQGANAIIVNPADRKALDSVIKQAKAKGIVVVAVDQAVSAPEAYVATNDQVKYGELGGQWLFQKLGGQGEVLYMRGIKGVPADSDRDKGFRKALKKFPGIKLTEVFSEWNFATGATIASQQIASGKQFDGVWTSGIDYTIVDAFKQAGVKVPPIVGADTKAFIKQLLDGQVGAAVTNPATIGGVGTRIALDVLAGKKPKRTTLLTPAVWDSVKNKKELNANYYKNRPATDSARNQVKPYTTYTDKQLFDCKGP